MNQRSRRNDNHEIDIFGMLGILAQGGGFAGMFGRVTQDPTDRDVVNLGHGITLVTDKSIEHNTSCYSHLIKDGARISDAYFRLGGMSSGFNKKPYAALIHYPGYPNNESSWGNHCIIDINGKIVLEAEPFDSSFYYLDGVIAKRKERFVNLLTGQDIVRSYSNYLKSADFFFVECNDYENKFEQGIYKINFRTGEYEIFKK